MRFRQKKIGICGDILKMDHMSIIPSTDQHVHRYLWRNYEIKRKPDTYLKTVLTFRDHPTPTMTITALKKTT